MGLSRPGSEPRRRRAARSRARVGSRGSAPGRADTHARAEELVDLDQHRLGNRQLRRQFAHERCCEPVRPITTIRGRDQRPRVGNDPQRARTRSRK